MPEKIDYAKARQDLTVAIEAFLLVTGNPDLVPNAWVLSVNSKNVKHIVGQSHITHEYMGDMATIMGLTKIQTMELEEVLMEDMRSSL